MGLNFADQKEASEVFDLIKEKSKRSKESKLTVKPVMTQQQPGLRGLIFIPIFFSFDIFLDILTLIFFRKFLTRILWNLF